LTADGSPDTAPTIRATCLDRLGASSTEASESSDPPQRIASDMMNARPIGIACHMVLTSLTPYVADVLLRTNSSVAGAMLLILGTSAIHLLRRLIHSSIKPHSIGFRELSSHELTRDLASRHAGSARLFTRGHASGSIQTGAFGRLCKPRASFVLKEVPRDEVSRHIRSTGRSRH
jgi:hypothetical protein